MAKEHRTALACLLCLVLLGASVMAGGCSPLFWRSDEPEPIKTVTLSIANRGAVVITFQPTPGVPLSRTSVQADAEKTVATLQTMLPISHVLIGRDGIAELGEFRPDFIARVAKWCSWNNADLFVDIGRDETGRERAEWVVRSRRTRSGTPPWKRSLSEENNAPVWSSPSRK